MAKKKKNPDAEMTLMDHLNELRGLLFRAAIAIVVTSTVCYIYSKFIFDNIIFAPKSSNFITYQWLVNSVRSSSLRSFALELLIIKSLTCTCQVSLCLIR